MTGTRTRIVATNAIDAETRTAIRNGSAYGAIARFCARSGTITRQAAFVVRIGVGGNGPACTIGAATLLCCATGITRPRADIAAADAIDAIIRQTIRSTRARRAIVLLARTGTGTRSGCTFIVGIGIVFDVSTRAIRSIAFFGRRTCLAGATAGRVATITVDTEAGSALRSCGTRRAVGLRGLRLVTRTRTITFAWVAFVVWIFGGSDGSTRAVTPLPFFHRRTCVTRTRAYIATTNAIDAIVRKTLARGRARRAVVITTGARTVAPSAVAFIVRIGFRRDSPARTIGAASFFRDAARLTCARTRRVATITVDAIGRRALSPRYARRSIGLRRLWLIARPGTIAFAGIAFVLGILARRHRPANAIIALTLLGFGTGITHAGADVATTKSVDAIPRQTLRFVRTRHAIVLFAHAFAVARAAPAFFVGIFVVGDVAARPITAAAFFCSRARLAIAKAPTVTTHPIRTIPG